MRPENRAAYIIAQAAVLNARIVAMRARDEKHKLMFSVTYWQPENYEKLLDEYSVLSHNGCLMFLEDDDDE